MAPILASDGSRGLAGRYPGELKVVDLQDQHGRSVHPSETGNLRGKVVELDEVHVIASPMLRDLEQIGYARKAALAREARRNLFERNRDDGIDFDLTFFEVVSLADTNVRTHPDANASRDRTTSHAIAQVFREQHRASLARCFPLQRELAAVWPTGVGTVQARSSPFKSC
jgi:hypothetical protein